MWDNHIWETMGKYGNMMRKHREMMGNHRNWSEMVKWWENDGWVDKQNQGAAPCTVYLVLSPHSNTTIKNNHVHI